MQPLIDQEQLSVAELLDTFFCCRWQPPFDALVEDSINMKKTVDCYFTILNILHSF